MEYKVIFSTGYSDDSWSLEKDYRNDILLLDEKGNYYAIQFITVERIKVEFEVSDICYLEENMVILHEITKENILKSIPKLHKWLFFECWVPLPKDRLSKYLHFKEMWAIFTVEVKDDNSLS